MRHALTVWSVALLGIPAIAQPAPPQPQPAPIYQITVIERTAKAINYQYRSGPTKIDFRGTVLLPRAKGEATVESKRGRTEVDAKFEHLTPPTPFGREYLTYTLWAITPQGAPHNLGELVPDGSNSAKLHVTTGLQAFGLIVTAEPYSAARRPSDVVVMENEVRPDTTGQIQDIQVKYELMPRGHYTWEMPASLATQVAGRPALSMDRYEALLEVYEAQNAVGIARSANAEQYAPATFDKAQRLLEQAQRLDAAKVSTNEVVRTAREAAQTAEDARVMADRRSQEEKVAAAEQREAQARDAQRKAQADARSAEATVAAVQARADADRLARAQAEVAAAAANERARRAEARVQTVVVAPTVVLAEPDKNRLRGQLLQQLSGVASTLDTPRGLVVTLSDPSFRGSELREPAIGQLGRCAAILAAHPGLRVRVEGYTDNSSGWQISDRRADAVERSLLAQGMAASAVSAVGLGDSRPLAPNTTQAGREQNRRVEIVISGDAIGTLPVWDRTYSLKQPR